MVCRKCGSPGKVLIRKEYCYCDDCFNVNTNHKFRACIGKNRIISTNDKVLICFSGDANSVVLLDLVHIGISLNNHKKLRITPYFLHIIENNGTENTKSIIDHCNKYGFSVEVINMNEYLKKNVVYNIKDKNLDNSRNLNYPSTIKYDIEKNLKRNIFLKIAKELQCKIVFTAETNTSLAQKLLSNIAIGRGSQVENDTGFADNRDENVKILRPMKDISNEEVENYIQINNLYPPYTKNQKENSLQSIIQNFVLDLQGNYPATISTICKTADKMSSCDTALNVKKCSVCKSMIYNNPPNISAVDATMFSKKVSFTKSGEESDMDNVSSNKEINAVFPLIYDSLCYSCSRNYAELEHCK